MKDLLYDLFVKHRWETLLIVICSVFFGYFSFQKEGYHMDELLSYEFSNAYYNPWIVPTQPQGRLAKYMEAEVEDESFIQTCRNLVDAVVDVIKNRENSDVLSYEADVYSEPVWISRKQFRDYIEIDGKDAFQYFSVYFNVKDDNHPPLYFMVLHTVCSFLQNTVKPIMGCAVNFIFMIFTLILVMGIGKEMAFILGMDDQEQLAGVMAGAFYGLSAGAMSTVLLTRMYAMLTFFCVATFYIQIKKWHYHEFISNNKLLTLVTLFGFWTQYYFLFFCIPLAIYMCIALFRSKRKRELGQYIKSMLIAAVLGVGLFPFAIGDVFKSGRGVEALGNLISGFSDLGERFFGFGRIFFWQTPLAIFFVLAFGLFFVNMVSHKGKANKTALGLLCVPTAVYILLAVKVSPYLVDRYVMAMFPFISIIGVTLVLFFIRALRKSRGGKRLTAICFLLVFLAQGFQMYKYDWEYLYKGYDEQLRYATINQEFPCICVYDGFGFYENLVEFTEYDSTLLLTLNELKERKALYSVSSLDQVIVLVKEEVDFAEVEKTMSQKYGFKRSTVVNYNSSHGDKYCLFER